MDDHDLLRQYARCHSQDAFRQLVEKHLVMVFSCAQRMVRDSHLAEEVAQNVFTTFAQKAESIHPPQVIAGWLYNTTRNLAMHTVRSEQRRRLREETAVTMQALDSDSDAGHIKEHLEPAMSELEPDDRDTLVLRYFEDRSLREVGQEFGISEDAARMRVNRALEKLRTIFNRKGIAVTSVSLAAILTASTTSAVPVGLTVAITTAALAKTIVTSTTIVTNSALTVMNWINAKSVTAIISAAVIAATSTYFAQERHLDHLRAENQTLAAEHDKLKSANDTSLASLQAKTQELDRLRKENKDLPRLRNEIAQLRHQRDAEKQTATQQAKLATNITSQLASPIPGSGRYITTAELAFAGYATPEAAFQSMNWAMLKGTYEDVSKALAPELLEQELKDPKGRKQFESGQKIMAPLIKGTQILSRKVLDADHVELKVHLDADPIPNSTDQQPPLLVQPMVRVGNEWKLGGGTISLSDDWDQSGEIQAVTP
ncbi:RNA polymerase sigma factor [Pedosphaera parvula]|uniref:RNA polymerase, sigma-24 subunit, ECF subfamily n=1 Tax=Pedosphaera parvula (strain Ellin514) TaxID=320771 RepID=B9XAA5_PEDPL|nr:sigma-70 family RNA polymerase sigma factor [Pedosphaera parvula]EEF63446.1 RNA polymerase, sigma-24 subunit, ECF subfamily [Pedosphaera parvula Ellin514]